MRITFKLDKTIQVFRLGKTTNKKISDGKEKIVQSYTFSEDQYNYKGVNAVICPASDEAGFKSTCAACGLCSGSMGKGKKNVVILEH